MLDTLHKDYLATMNCTVHCENIDNTLNAGKHQQIYAYTVTASRIRVG